MIYPSRCWSFIFLNRLASRAIHRQNAIRHQKQRKGTPFRQTPSADHSIGRSSLKLSKWTLRRQAKVSILGGELPYLFFGMYSICIQCAEILYICEITQKKSNFRIQFILCPESYPLFFLCCPGDHEDWISILKCLSILNYVHDTFRFFCKFCRVQGSLSSVLLGTECLNGTSEY